MVNKSGVNISVLSYEHDFSRNTYTLESLGNDFDINVAPENILMALCAHHQAKKLIEIGEDVTIVTVGGSATSNALIMERINELTNTPLPVIADTNSNSIASNIKSLTQYDPPFLIICQKFAKLRTYIHSEYYLGSENFQLLEWESCLNQEDLNPFETELMAELKRIAHIPMPRKASEGILTALALIDPENGFTQHLSELRERLRNEDPQDNIFNKSGLS